VVISEGGQNSPRTSLIKGSEGKGPTLDVTLDNAGDKKA
jgi:hypothetical protein